MDWIILVTWLVSVVLLWFDHGGSGFIALFLAEPWCDALGTTTSWCVRTR